MRLSGHVRFAMTAQEQVQAFSERIRPHLEELGVEAFVMCAYMKDGEGKVSRVTLGGNPGNPAYEDGLRTLQVLMAKWGQGQL
jgi:hypothetical protein